MRVDDPDDKIGHDDDRDANLSRSSDRVPDGARNARAREDAEYFAGGDVLTVDEAAKMLRVGKNALYDAIGRNEVPHQRIGRVIRLSRVALIRWLDTNPPFRRCTL